MKSPKVLRTFAIILGVFLSVVIVSACAVQSEKAIPNPKIANAVQLLENIKDVRVFENTASQEQSEAVMYLYEETDAWNDVKSYLVMLRHESDAIRVIAAKQIYNSTQRRNWIVPDDDPFEKLLKNLIEHDPVLDVRANAIQALGEMHADSSCNILVDLVKTSAAPGNPRKMQQQMSINNYWSALYVAVKKLSCPGTEKLFTHAEMGFQEIIDIYEKAEPARFFSDRSVKERRADKAFNRMDESENFDAFLTYINHPNQVVRNRIVQAIARSKKPEALAPLLDVLRNDPSIQVRYITIYSLGMNGYKGACPELAAVLTKEDFGKNTINTKNYLTAKKIHQQARLAMSRLHCRSVD